VGLGFPPQGGPDASINLNYTATEIEKISGELCRDRERSGEFDGKKDRSSKSDDRRNSKKEKKKDRDMKDRNEEARHRKERKEKKSRSKQKKSHKNVRSGSSGSFRSGISSSSRSSSARGSPALHRSRHLHVKKVMDCLPLDAIRHGQVKGETWEEPAAIQLVMCPPGSAAGGLARRTA
jgi:hypothetical protein